MTRRFAHKRRATAGVRVGGWISSNWASATSDFCRRSATWGRQAERWTWDGARG